MFLSLILVFLAVPVFAGNDGKALAALLERCLAQEEIHPDSIYPALRMLEQKRREAATPQEKAVYATALGRLYTLRAFRAQSAYQNTNAPLDSIQEWSSEDYRLAAKRCFEEALADKDLLFSVPTKDWVPVVSRGRDDAVFGNNMLYVVWSTMQMGEHAGTPTFSDMIRYYKDKGMREAAFLLEMDSLNMTYSDKREAGLKRIAEEYADLDVSAQALLQLLLESRDNWQYRDSRQGREERYAQLKDILARYPGYKGKAAIRNAMLEVKVPILDYQWPELAYTGRELPVALQYRNLSSYTFTLYLLPKDFEEEKMDGMKEEDRKAWLRKNARLIQTYRKACSDSPFETVRDTLHVMVPEHGRYAMLTEAQTREKLQDKMGTTQLHYFRASHFKAIMFRADQQTYLTVLNAYTGKPEPNVDVEVKWASYRNEEREIVEHYVTDERGRALIEHSYPNRSSHVSLRRGDDCYLPPFYIGVGGTRPVSHDYVQHYALNTDRAIYRPGQTIHISGTCYRQLEWDAMVCAGADLSFSLRDTDYKLVLDTILTTDEFGCVALDYTIPSNAKLGRYRLELDNYTRYVRVEEYKRPTFEVQIEEPVLGDSVLFAGRALTYAGVPVRNARVTGQYRWSMGWYRLPGDNLYRQPVRLDTLWTDDEGRFTVRVPIQMTEEEVEEMKLGRWLSLDVDVLHSNGETHSASVSLCSTPLRIFPEVAEKQDRDNLRPWHFDLRDALGKEVKAEVKVELLQAGKAVYMSQQESCKDLIPTGLLSVPSGAYTLQATAVVKGDTAIARQRLVLFSMQDNTLPVDTASWFYCPTDKFSPSRPARIQVGSSLRDVTLYYLVSSQEKVLKDELICFSDSVFTLEIPYQKSMGKTACVTLYFVKDNMLYQKEFDLLLEQPDYELKARWTTFRDWLMPGEQETWSLTLHRPDGTPAQANLLATLYDASLDAFASHSLNLNVTRSHDRYRLSPHTDYRYNSYHSLNFLLKFGKVRGRSFGSLDDRYFALRSRGREEGRVLYMYSTIQAPMRAGVRAKDFAGMGVTSVDEALQGRIAGLDIVDNSAQLGTGAAVKVRGTSSISEEAIQLSEPAIQLSEPALEADAPQTDWSALRTNFGESAFFYPQLRTNAQGELSIQFKLPESLTRWHFLGVAHTQDMLVGSLDESIVAQKSLMAQLYLPRFLRVGDKASLTATVQNIDQEKAERGTAVFELLDAGSEKVLLRRKLDFSLQAGKDTVFHFDYEVKDAHSDLICRWVAEGEQCSDGEQRLLPVLSDRETVVTTKALKLLEAGTLNYDLKGLFPNDATSPQLVVEYTTHPAWSAMEALAALTLPEREDVLSLASSYYASMLTRHILTSVPGAGQVLGKAGGKTGSDPILYTDTIAGRAERSLHRLESLQLNDGSFVWYPGSSWGSPYLTREVAYLLARLQVMTQQQAAPHADAERAKEMLGAAIRYLRSLQRQKEQISTTNLRHLYIVSMAGEPLNKVEKDLLGQLAKSADEWSVEDRALAAIVLCLQDKNRATNRMMDGVEKYLAGTPQEGRYIDYPGGTFTSIDRKLHIHTQIMEALRLVRPADKQLWSGMMQYLLLQKRTTDWNTPVNTANAVYVLMQGELENLTDQHSADRLVVKGRRYSQQFKPEDHAKGYLKDTVQVESPQNLRIEKQSAGQSWAAVYAQFEQQTDSVSAHWQGVNIRREFSNPNPKVGEKVYVRYVVTANQDYDYVLLHAPRPAAMEPQQTWSGASRLGVYRSVHDQYTDYYIEHLSKGTYVLEEEMSVEREGSYGAGITTIQCLYAPEFSARTGNLKLNVRR